MASPSSGARCDAANLRVGMVLSRNTEYVVRAINGSSITISNGRKTWNIDRDILANECYDTHSAGEVKEVTRTEMVEMERKIHDQQKTIQEQRDLIEMHEHRQMSMGVVEKKEEEEDWFSCLFNNTDESQRASGASSPRGRCTPTPAQQLWSVAPSP